MSTLSSNHVECIVSKAGKRFFMLYKRAGVGQRDILNIYVSVIRPVLEYACQVWHTNLPSYLSDNIERIQIRAMKCIYPGHNYDYIQTNMAKLPTLQQRRDVICRKYFNKVKNVNHKLHHLLPARRTNCSS